jgi:hypothetical protein
MQASASGGELLNLSADADQESSSRSRGRGLLAMAFGSFISPSALWLSIVDGERLRDLIRRFLSAAGSDTRFQSLETLLTRKTTTTTTTTTHKYKRTVVHTWVLCGL